LSVTMSRLDFAAGPNPDLAYPWDTKHKLFSLAEVCAVASAVLVFPCFLPFDSPTFSSLGSDRSFPSRSLLLLSESILCGSEVPSWHPCPLSSKCGSANRSTMNLGLPSCIANASKICQLIPLGLSSAVYIEHLTGFCFAF